mmetsp:Transcript_10055/g.20970  ORF Transcript_10055/g.20970 Transcript_10055/m.20970 type:complete len:86 (+) Transcript_10055:397-654(+)
MGEGTIEGGGTGTTSGGGGGTGCGGITPPAATAAAAAVAAAAMFAWVVSVEPAVVSGGEAAAGAWDSNGWWNLQLLPYLQCPLRT